jgi:hypothetical protein
MRRQKRQSFHSSAFGIDSQSFRRSLKNEKKTHLKCHRKIISLIKNDSFTFTFNRSWYQLGINSTSIWYHADTLASTSSFCYQVGALTSNWYQHGIMLMKTHQLGIKLMPLQQHGIN